MKMIFHRPHKIPVSKNEKGVILLISLWILVILSVLAVGLGHQLSLEIRLLQNHLDSAKAFFVAKAGMERAIAERVLALESANPVYADSYNQPWFNDEDVFKNAAFGEGAYTVENVQMPGLYGMSDEQAKININKAPRDVLKALLIEFGVNDDVAAGNIADAIKGYRGDADGIISDDYYQSQNPPYHCKKSAFDSVDEILLVKDITPDIFYGKDINGNNIIEPEEEGIKNYITVYGKVEVNINTAPLRVLKIMLGEDIAGYIIKARQIGKWFVAISPSDPLPLQDIDKIINILNSTPESDFLNNLDDTTRTNAWKFLQDKYNVDKIISVTSSTFRINSSASAGGLGGIKRNIETVIKFSDNDQNKAGYVFLYWRQA